MLGGVSTWKRTGRVSVSRLKDTRIRGSRPLFRRAGGGVFYAIVTPFGGGNLCATVDVNHLDKNSCDGSSVGGRWPDTCGCREERTARALLTTSRKCVTQPARTIIEPWIGSTGCDASLCRSPHATPPNVDSPVTSGTSHQGTPRPTLTEHRGNGRRNQ